MAEPDLLKHTEYPEDKFELSELKKTAPLPDGVQYDRVTRIKLSVYKTIIWILALIIMFFLYRFFTKLIVRYDYEKYSKTSGSSLTKDVDFTRLV